MVSIDLLCLCVCVLHDKDASLRKQISAELLCKSLLLIAVSAEGLHEETKVHNEEVEKEMDKLHGRCCVCVMEQPRILSCRAPPSHYL